MKKLNIIAAVCCFALVSIGFGSCKGVEWDTEEALIGMSNSWAYYYVGTVINKYEDYHNDAPDSTGEIHSTMVFNDTVAVETLFSGILDGDSLHITTSVFMVDTTSIVTTDGYRIADNLTAHIFTVNPGIVNYEGILHIDFYKTDGLVPWAWTEVLFKKENQLKGFRHYTFTDTRFGWY